MKGIIGIILAVLTGVLVGFFGAFNSVFSDGGMGERLITIAIVLLVYGTLGFIWGVILPTHGWKWGLILGAPGALFIGMFLLNEWQPLMVVYVVLILLIPLAGAWSGSQLRRSKAGKSQESR